MTASYHSLTVEEVLKAVGSSLDGLTAEEARKRLKEYGYNELKEKRKIISLKVLLRQFTNFIIYVLFAATLISLFIGEILNFWVISFIIIFVIILGFIQEYKAERAMEALKKIVQPTAKILRDGRLKIVLTKEIVPGDILLLETGDKVPADAKILEIIGLKVDESTLTGESIAVEKKKADLIFAGTQVVYGKCKALVTTTGMQTKLGEIAGLIQEAEEKTPLQVKIDHLAKTLTIIALSASLLIFVLGLFRGAIVSEMLIIALALAVAAVPEGLPLTLTLTLSYGMYNMAKHNAIIRKMLGVETLGSTTVICTDKTGTLTKGEMSVEQIFVGDKIFTVSGSGYDLKGSFSINGNTADIKKEKDLNLLLKAAVLCNNAVMEEKGKFEVVGDPTEGALIITGAKAGLWKNDLESEHLRIEEFFFTSERKIMTTIHKRGREKIAFTKGAPEIILAKCKFIQKNNKIEKLDKSEINKLLNVNNNFASSAYRVLGIAHKRVSGSLTPENVETDMIFLGLVAMIDPPREEVGEAIEVCKKAGIKVIMITGDNEETAKAIAKRIGISESNNLNYKTNDKLGEIVMDGAITGSELEELNDEEFESVVDDIYIYARILPEQKVRIVNALKKKGHIVAMTGDGVNDAPALKKADIGIAMGIKGTDVAKESSVMILQDDNFATIVEAVRHGRTIYQNIENFTTYLISRNFTEVILILLGVLLLGFEFLPLLALQILFINTFDEIMPAIGLGLEPTRKGIMSKKPRYPKEQILKKRNLILIISVAIFMALASFLVFILNNPEINLERARTLTFATIACIIFFVPFAFRSLDEHIYNMGIFTNKLLLIGVGSTLLLTLSVMYIPFFQNIFKFTILSLKDWIIPITAAFFTLIFVEIMKTITNKISMREAVKTSSQQPC